MRGLFVAVVLAAFTACIEPNLQYCDDGTACAVDKVCLAGGGCGDLDDVSACEGRADGEPCESGFGGGRCRAGACRAATCGDGIIDGAEVCDDGNTENGDGCSGTCLSDESCGNGISELLETCDCGDADHPGSVFCMGTVNGGTICRSDCTLVSCGNGMVEALEVCDDGNLVSGDDCNSTCSSDETCGNGIQDLDEECDDGNLDQNDTCSPECTIPRCGDGFLDAGELCDDDNNMPGDGCSFDCMSDESCGNGVTDYFAGELCDDGAIGLLHDGCTDRCLTELTTWSEVTNAEVPDVRHAHAAVHDSTRGSLMMFGGMTGALLHSGETSGTGLLRSFGDLWEWDPLGLHWVEHRAPGPSPRFAHAMAYDSIRKRIVLFGGFGLDAGGTLVSLDDTWEWDSLTTQWTRVEPLDVPPARGTHVMAFDPDRGRVVMFGGGTASTLGAAMCGYLPSPDFADTWEWTGTNWVNRTPSMGSPAGRVAGGLVYDPVRDRMVLLPGLPVGDGKVYDWNGTLGSWTARTTTVPPGTFGYAAAYDEARARIVQFGGELINTSGCGLDTASDRMHTYDPATDAWTQLTPTRPDRRGFTAGAYLPGLQIMIVVAGTYNVSYTGSNQIHYNDTWNWNGTAWSEAVTPTPPKLHDARAVYDSARQQIVLYGGATGPYPEQNSSETWIWDGYAWSKRTPVASPGYRVGHAMAYDARRERVVLFGGGMRSGSTAASNQTWEWDGSNWALSPAMGPAARSGAAMVYDAERQHIVLFGGTQSQDSGGIYPPYTDTWTFDGTTWNLVASTGPSARIDHEMAYDARRKVVVLYGGTANRTYGNQTDLGDTWEWNGQAWALRAATGIGVRSRHRLVDDPLHLGVVMFGGIMDATPAGGLPDELWRWDGDAGVWREVVTSVSPPARYGHVAAYDGARHELVIAFGIDKTLEDIDDSWSLRTAYLGSPEQFDDDCSGSSDVDDDGKLGCDDPDCWSYCTPACPPSTSCPTTGTKYCGDGVCDEPRENSVRCPDDCN